MIDKIDFQPTRPIRKKELIERIASERHRTQSKWLNGKPFFQTVPDTGFYFRAQYDGTNDNGIITHINSNPSWHGTWAGYQQVRKKFLDDEVYSTSNVKRIDSAVDQVRSVDETIRGTDIRFKRTHVGTLNAIETEEHALRCGRGDEGILIYDKAKELLKHNIVVQWPLTRIESQRRGTKLPTKIVGELEDIFLSSCFRPLGNVFFYSVKVKEPNSFERKEDAIRCARIAQSINDIGLTRTRKKFNHNGNWSRDSAPFIELDDGVCVQDWLDESMKRFMGDGNLSDKLALEEGMSMESESI